MKKKKENINEEEMIKIKEDFEGLNEEQKKLLVYTKFIDLSDQYGIYKKLSKEEKEKFDKTITMIIEASELKISRLNALMPYSFSIEGKQYREIYKESLEKYRKVLENYRILTNELKIVNSLELSNLFTYMLWNGYFSATGEHIYKTKNRLSLASLNSFDVIKGGGVCLDYSELLKDYLDVCGVDSSVVLAKVAVDINENIRDYEPNIERKSEVGLLQKAIIVSSGSLLNGITNKMGNHAITLIKDNKRIYAYDSTNLCVLNVDSSDKASIINGKGIFELKPLTTASILPIYANNELFEKLLAGDSGDNYSRNEIIDSYEKVIALANDNKNLLNDSYEVIHGDLEFITNQMNEIGGRFKVKKLIKKL